METTQFAVNLATNYNLTNDSLGRESLVTMNVQTGCQQNKIIVISYIQYSMGLGPSAKTREPK